MCHTFLEFDFNENLNMVIGNNGSMYFFHRKTIFITYL
jgi:hypothetical protein